MQKTKVVNRISIKYLGTNLGKIYLSDVVKNHPDLFILWDQCLTLNITDDVFFSLSQGVLNYFSDQSSSKTFNHRAPLKFLYSA